MMATWVSRITVCSLLAQRQKGCNLIGEAREINVANVKRVRRRRESQP